MSGSNSSIPSRSVPQRIADGLNVVLAFGGLRLVRSSERPIVGSGPVPVRVGKFTILIPKTNPLVGVYRKNPDCNSELGRLVQAVRAKYPDAALVDVGANIGDTAAVARSVADLPILCVEGDPTCAAMLKENAKQFPGLVIEQCFLGESDGTVQAHLEKEGWNTTIIIDDKATPTAGGRSIPLRTLDSLLAAHADLNCRVLKVDTEGHDLKILRGASNLLATHKPAILLEYNRENLDQLGEDGVAFFGQLSAKGYRHALVYDAFGRLILTTDLANTELLRDLNAYIAPKATPIHYYDLCLFHQDEADVYRRFLEVERGHRDARSAH